jgi:A/G-specific adenine glycosylase
VLVSEVTLQQTQAARVAPAYERFLRRFPTMRALASAPAADVLREWGSLGYNRRALNVWRAAQAVAVNGSFPRTVEELQALPGVGPYTARAVASFAFGADCGVVDANVRRVITRALGAADVQAAADELVPPGDSAFWNQAMIDLGALVCTARNPSCSNCPLRKWCSWTPPSVTRRRRAAARFETTSRYVRGRIVAELRTRPMNIEALRRRVGVAKGRFDSALASLENDGLVHRAGDRASLGDGKRSPGATMSP